MLGRGRRFFAVANSTRKIGPVILQRRRVIAPSIAPGRIFFNKPLPPGFGRAKKRAGEKILEREVQLTRVRSLAHEEEQK
jgi:hypothetical protein